jgi:CheY-like chemotaxis protein
VSQSDSTESKRPAKILVAEDEELVLALFQAILKKAGFDLVCASTGNQAASMFDAEPDAFALLITDLSLPGMTGQALAEHVRKARPDIKIIFSTGSITDAPQEAVAKFKGSIFLAKPFGYEELVTIVNQALQN